MSKFYAGIGSRATPPAAMALMTALASSLELAGWVLRSGGAEGADEAFASGVAAPDNREIYLPWKGFNGNGSQLYLDRLPREVVERARDIASQVHPNWRACSEGARKLHVRNVLQIIGDERGNPRIGSDQISKFVICWTQDGKASGGTGQALRLADHFQVPIFNLQRQFDRLALYSRFDWSGSPIVQSALAR